MTPKQLLTLFDNAYRAHNEEIPAPINGSKDGPLAAKLIKRGYTDEQLTRWVTLFFTVPNDFVKRTGYTFGIFYSQIGIVIQHDRRVNAQRPAPLRQQVSQELRDHILEQRRIEAEDFANDYYKSRPWLTRPTTHR